MHFLNVKKIEERRCFSTYTFSSLKIHINLLVQNYLIIESLISNDQWAPNKYWKRLIGTYLPEIQRHLMHGSQHLICQEGKNGLKWFQCTGHLRDTAVTGLVSAELKFNFRVSNIFSACTQLHACGVKK